MNPQRRKFLIYQVPFILWAVIILTVSSIPQFAEVTPGWKNFDKVIHIIEYGIFGFLLTRALYFQDKNSIRKFAVILSILIGGAFAGLDEIHQRYIPGRFESLGDFAADLSGILLAQILFIYIFLRSKINKKSDFYQKLF